MRSQQELLEQIKVLSERIWEGRVKQEHVDAWLENFATQRERHLALHLLAQFSHFGTVELRELLKSLYRDLFRYEVLQEIRAKNADSVDEGLLEAEFQRELKHTRFLGMGNPSESGTHLLYYFRQENELPKDLFIGAHHIFTRAGGDERKQILRDASVRRYVFIDDFCGSGTQALEYSRESVEDLVAMAPGVKVSYLCLAATQVGLAAVREHTDFTQVDAIFVLDDSFKCFVDGSRYFLPDENNDRLEARLCMCRHGQNLWPSHPLGYKDGQLLLGFAYNVPDNTLPIIWASGDHGWSPVFRRYHKKGGA
jgi:hypothetical protein